MNRPVTFAALLLSILLFMSGCSSKAPSKTTPVPENIDADLSCSYFYFLWGAHAEFNQHFEEAQEAYEKALICDPSIQYIKEKIPILLLRMGKADEAISWLQEAISKDSENTNYRLLLASLYIQQKRFDEAISLYELVSKRKSDDRTIKLRLGLLYSQVDQFARAEKIFTDLSSDEEVSYAANLALGRLYRRTKEPDKAAASYEQALALNWSKDLAYEIGQLYLGLHRYEDALRILTTITDNDPFDELGALSRVQVLLDLQRETDALKELENIKQFSRNPTKIDIIVAKIFLRNDKVAEATRLLTEAARQTDDSEPEYLLGLIAYQQNQLEKSLEHLQRVTTSSHQFEESIYLQAQMLQELKRSEEAIALLKSSVGTEETRSPLFYALLASIYQKQKNMAAATLLLTEAIAAYPDNAELVFEYGMALERSSRHKEAMEQMMKVLQLEPEHAEALNYIGYTWADQNRNLDEALRYIEQANALRPENGFIVDSLGWVHYRLGNYARAVKELERATLLEPDDPHIFDHLGDVYAAMNRPDKAVESYRKAISKFTDQLQRQLIQDKIDALPGHP